MTNTDKVVIITIAIFSMLFGVSIIARADRASNPHSFYGDGDNFIYRFENDEAVCMYAGTNTRASIWCHWKGDKP